MQGIMLAAFTNQAVDNMLKRLDTEGFHDFVRLGNERSVDNTISGRLLKKLVEQKQNDDRVMETQQERLQDVHRLLQHVPVVASTTATWSSEKYAPSKLNETQENGPLQFNVAIIDQQRHLTIPARLVRLPFTKRYI